MGMSLKSIKQKLSRKKLGLTAIAEPLEIIEEEIKEQEEENTRQMEEAGAIPTPNEALTPQFNAGRFDAREVQNMLVARKKVKEPVRVAPQAMEMDEDIDFVVRVVDLSDSPKGLAKPMGLNLLDAPSEFQSGAGRYQAMPQLQKLKHSKNK